jgi:PAS domain S-box-containing protein
MDAVTLPPHEPTPAELSRLKAEAIVALREGRFDLADTLLARGDVTLAEITHNLRVYQAELEAQAQELRESNERTERVMLQFRRLFEALPQAALVVDRLGLIHRRNAEADRLFGLDDQALVKPALRRLAADPAARHALHSALAEAERTGRSRLAGVALADRQQQPRRADLYFERIEERSAEQGERFLVLMVDESQRVAAAERLAATNLALREQQRDNRTLAAVARSTHSMVVMTDAQRRVTWANQAFEQRSGWRCEELAGRSMRVLHGPGTDAVTVAQMHAHLARGEGFTGVEVLNFTKAGDPYWVVLDVQPVHGDEGQLEGFVSVQHDVTERRLAEQRLREAEAYQRAIFDATPALMAALRPDGRIGNINEAGLAMLQLATAAEASGRLLADFLAGDDVDTFRRLHQRAMLGEEATASVRLIGSRGRTTAVELHTGPLWRHSSVQLVVLVGRDISAEQALAAMRAEKEAALASNQAKTRFLSQMSHELRTPLNAVLGFSQLMAADLDAGQHEPATQRERLAFIDQAGWHLLSMIDDVLDLSLIESGRVELHLDAVALGPVVRGALALVQNAADRHGIRLSWDTAADDLTVRADTVRLTQVLSNLLSNAVKYNVDGGSVEVSAQAEGDGIRLAVADSGRGLAPQELEHLFEPFNRLGAPSHVEGSGIGLVIARHLVQLMGGRIDVASASGEGSTFTVCLPAAPAQSDPMPADGDAEPAAAPLARPCSVLYIEDIDSNIELMHHALDGTGWQLRVERTGRKGLMAARDTAPDLILLDLQLPDLDGVEVRRRLLADPATAAIPCVAITADVAARAAEPPDVPFDAWLSKPLRIPVMQRVMAQVVRAP